MLLEVGTEVTVVSTRQHAFRAAREFRMFKLLKMTAMFGAGLLIACGAANATPVPAGTVSATLLAQPLVNNTAGTIQFVTPAFVITGTGQFAGFNGSATMSTSTFSF